MANNGREFKKEQPFGQKPDEQLEKNTEGEYGDHPLLGDDKEPFGKDLFRSPEQHKTDPKARSPEIPPRSKVTPIRGPSLHDPSLDYQPPSPITVVPPANAAMKLLGGVVALLLFALVVWFLFHNWTTPSLRHPGEPKQGQELRQKIP
ncbi:MAG TPA: hypothetical protein VM578_12780 [Candidatus Saccharimonadales bacterium]|nr:hypothetical protein [Candidatus Saccharimonadales bacterium]